MSYDLYFRRPEARGPLAPDELLGYFEGRPHYRVDRAHRQAVYENQDTGVYFVFEASTPFEDDPEENEELGIVPDGTVDAGASFNLNYIRPHVFGLEAEPEVTAFVRHFGLSVDDPQNDGMGRGAYSAEGFLAGWNAGNRFGYRVALDQEDAQYAVSTLPRAEIARIWRWNRQRAPLQQQLGDDVFVPKIMIAKLDGGLQTIVAWADAIPSALPATDAVVFARLFLAKRWFFGLLPGKPDKLFVPRAELEPVLASAPTEDGYRLVTSPEVLARLKAFVRARPAELPDLEIIGLDKVLDRDLLDEARATASA